MKINLFNLEGEFIEYHPIVAITIKPKDSVTLRVFDGSTEITIDDGVTEVEVVEL